MPKKTTNYVSVLVRIQEQQQKIKTEGEEKGNILAKGRGKSTKEEKQKDNICSESWNEDQ